MEAAIALLIKRHPLLSYFDLKQALTPQQLQLFDQNQIQTKGNSCKVKQIQKVMKKLTLMSQQKMREGKKLYKALQHSNQYTDSIILNNSNLKSIEAIQYKRFPNLNQLQLSSNQIRSVNPLKNTKIPCIQSIDLSCNLIEALKPLRQVEWPKLRILNLHHNCIVSLQNFPLSSFISIKEIDMSDNFLKEVRCLRKSFTYEMKNLRQINLSNNQIADIRWISECYFHKLQYLNIRNNRYSSFLDIQKVLMSQGGGQATCQYTILVSSRGKNTSYVVGFRTLSRHKHSVVIDPHQQRTGRQIIQKSRRLILY